MIDARLDGTEMAETFIRLAGLCDHFGEAMIFRSLLCPFKHKHNFWRLSWEDRYLSSTCRLFG